jgi:hypothetical protein
MSVSFVSSNGYSSGSSTVSSFNVPAPTLMAQYDYLMIFISVTGGTGTTITAPSGWSLSLTTNNGTTYGQRVYTKYASATEAGPYTFTIGTSERVSAVSAAYRGTSSATYLGSRFVVVGGVSGNASGTGTTSISTWANCDPAFGIKFSTDYNTTGVSVVTNDGTGYTHRSDASTTGGIFMDSALADGGTGNGLRSVTVPASTFSVSSTANTLLSIFLRQDLSVLTSPNVDYINRFAGGSFSSYTYTMNLSRSNELCALMVYIQGATGTVTSITTPGTTWTQKAVIQNPGATARLEVWTAQLGAQAANATATINFSTTLIATVANLNFLSTTKIGNFQTASAASGVATSTLTTTAANSWVLGAVAYADNSGITVVSPNISYMQAAYSSGLGVCLLTQQVVASSGTSTTSSTSAPTASPWAMVQFEASNQPLNALGQFLM